MSLLAPVLMVLILALILYLLRGTFTHPRTTLANLVNDPRGKAFAALALGTVAVPYSLVELFLYLQTTIWCRPSCVFRLIVTTRGQPFWRPYHR